jgi:hypothetical protein
MTHAFTQEVPADKAFYARIKERLGDAPPPGLVVHVAIENPDGGLRYIDVWESEEAWQTFAEERLHPIVHGLLAEVFGDERPPEPSQSPLSVIHVWTQSTSADT